MSHSVNVNTDSNQVVVQIATTDNTVQVQKDTSNDVVQVNAKGPKGDAGPAGTLTSNSGASITGSLFVSGSDSVVDFSDAGALTASNILVEGDILTVLGNVFVEGTLDASTKNFKIQHPTMPGYYLMHSSLEGPERGIYHRGKLKTSNIIHLPDYWKDLPVDDTDITVQLTPIGNACQHFIKSVTKEEIEVGCECGKPHCYYIVHAQRYNEGKFNILQPKQIKKL